MKIADVLVEAEARRDPRIYYFAYGMLTDPEQIHYSEGRARFIGQATLKNYKFEILAHANVRQDPDSSVTGVLWQIDKNKLDYLDYVEGYPDYYRRQVLPVYCGGRRYMAEVYVMTNESRKFYLDHDSKPSKQYVNTIKNGYTAANISQNLWPSVITNFEEVDNILSPDKK